jgi:hypothetical protein
MKILLSSQDERKFSGLLPFPTELMNEDWAKNIHGQDLATLDRRGGMSPQEIVGNIQRLSFRQISGMKIEDAVAKMTELLPE